MTHTKGPWRISNLERPHHVLVCNEQWYTIAQVFSANKSGDTEANARLIASAPDLLEALETLERAHIKGFVDLKNFKKRTTKAIQKARGHG